uniref:DUF4939 domain-containing protein n=1 Tax=Cyprinus carpio TaxID=7962 RepID=A0A8C1Y214_CYPCA
RRLPYSPHLKNGAFTVPTPMLVYMANSISRPAPFSGREEDCNGFLLQCSLALEQHAHQYPTERSKISFIIQQLSGPALRWAEALWFQESTITSSLQNFIGHFKEVFGRPVVFLEFRTGHSKWME